MNITWFGTAGFKVETGNFTVLIDPYFSRNQQAVPRQPIRASDIEQADMIFISHHQDNFYPPISTMVDTRKFIQLVKGTNPDTAIRIPVLNETMEW